jgi:hypothetical protein
VKSPARLLGAHLLLLKYATILLASIVGIGTTGTLTQPGRIFIAAVEYLKVDISMKTPKPQNITIQSTDPFLESTKVDLQISGNGSICWYAVRDGGLYAGRFNCFCNTDLCNDSGRHIAAHFYLIAIFFMLKYIS